MRIKNVFLINIITMGIMTSAVCIAQPHNILPPEQYKPATCDGLPPPPPSFADILTSDEKNTLQNMMDGMHQQMIPLIKSENALELQLAGKIATPNTQWDDLTPLLQQINENQAKIEALKVKTQLEIFQKTGVMIPNHPPFPPFLPNLHDKKAN